jgi:glucuronate isomerase
MKKFLDENFLLRSKIAERLYHEFARDIPIIDYHNHLSPQEIAEDRRFDNLTQAWLYGDHYKWRAMRTCGVEESFITGSKTDWEKFEQWSITVPYTMRNPLYHWTHLELQRYFNIHEILRHSSAPTIYKVCGEKLREPEFSVRGLLSRLNVELLCTTDDPADDLSFHQSIMNDNFDITVLPAFRPDHAMNVSNPSRLQSYIQKLESVCDRSITNYYDYLTALKSRHDFFASMGCRVSDHGLEYVYADDFTDSRAEAVFNKIRSGSDVDTPEKNVFRSAMLYHFACWDHEKGWVQQFHLGALRNNNTRKMQELGADTGWDSIGDFPQASALSKFLDRLDRENKLARTVIYNLNPADNAVFSTMTGNFNDGSVAGKIQWGSAWWYLDQKEGMIQQLNTLSTTGLISRFIGMLTDSRSFLSFPRHEYFRRILCNLFAEDIENGELPHDINWTGKLIQDICYNNNKHFFRWDESKKPALS